MKITAELPTDIDILQKLVLEQNEMIRSLREQLLLALRRQFGPRNEQVNIDQLTLFAVDSVPFSDGESGDAKPPSEDTPAGQGNSRSRKGLACTKDLPREIREIDIPESKKICPCCAGRLHAFGFDASEHVHYVPASLKLIETRRLKYSCRRCYAGVERAPADKSAPIPKSMASASLIAFLAVCKFADHQPAYRISAHLRRLGIELSHGVMSDWLVQSGELVEAVHSRIMDRVLASGHIFTDDTILPMQALDPDRRSTLKSRIWCYATHHRRGAPLVAYEFSLTRSQQVPLRRLADYCGHVQCDAFPGYDRVFDTRWPGTKAVEVACWAHARRKFVEVAALTKVQGRAHEALAFIRSLYRIEKQIREFGGADRRTERQQRSLPVLKAFKAWLDREVNAVLPKSALGVAIVYTLRNWDALCRYTEEGYLEIDNNTAERHMRPIALGRKNFLFVGSERGGHAAAIWYTLIESCKLNGVNPLSYLTYLLENVRNKAVELPMPDEFGRLGSGVPVAA
jgi:transposase